MTSDTFKISMLNIVLFHLMCLSPVIMFSQNTNELTIEECYQRATDNFPLIKQYDILDKVNDLSIDNLSLGNRPFISFFGQATFQSDVTSIPFTLPNAETTNVSKDQYKLYGEITKSLTDSKIIKKKQQIAIAKTKIEKKKLDVDIYKIKEKINQIFFAVLLMDLQMAQSELLQKDIHTGIQRLEVAVENGTAIPSDILQLKAENLQIDQRTTEIKSQKTALTNVLAILINKDINQSTTFVKPSSIVSSNSINRPELQLFDLQSKSIEEESELIDIRNKPRLSVFLQSGIGRPALNFLNNDIDPYMLGGLRFNWNIHGNYTKKNDKELFTLQKQSIDVQKEVFLFNNKMEIQDESEEIFKLKSLIEKDNEIVNLRTEVKEIALTQLENGIITSSDYLTYVNAEDKARQNLLIHEIQLRKSQYMLKTTKGNK